MQTMTATANEIQNSTANVYEWLRNYSGSNSFMISLKSNLLRYGKLTERQLPYAVKFFEEQQQQTISSDVVKKSDYPTYKLKNPFLITIKGQYFVKDLCESKLLLGDVISYAWVITEVTGITPKAVKVKAKIADSKHNLNFCRACCRSLTDKFSIATGMGKICSEKYGIPYLTDMSQVDAYKMKLDEKINQIGEKEFWLPKSKVVEITELMNVIDNLKNSSHNKKTDKKQVSNFFIEKLMENEISFSVLSESKDFSVVNGNDVLAEGLFSDCLNVFLDKFNSGDDISLNFSNIVFNLNSI
jgi:hypothetical protein